MSTVADKKPSKKPYDRPPNSKGKDKRDEDACKIRRPQNSWILYRKDKFELLRKEAEAENKPRPIAADASKIISEAWKNESQEVKKYYNELAEKEKARHAEEHPDYKFKPRTKAQKLQEKEAKEFGKKRKGDDSRNERDAKSATRSTRGVGSDKMPLPLPAGIPLFYPSFAMAPPPLPGQQPSAGSSAAAPIPWFPFAYPAYLPTPTIPPAVKEPKASTTTDEATTPEAGPGPTHQTPGEHKATKVMAKEKKRRSLGSNSTGSSHTASSAGAPTPAASRANRDSSPRVVTPPKIQKAVGVSKSTPVRRSSSSSRHSMAVSIHCHGCLNLKLTFTLICRRRHPSRNFRRPLLSDPNPNLKLLHLHQRLLSHSISIYSEYPSQDHQHNPPLPLSNHPRSVPLPTHQTRLLTQRRSP